MTTNKQEVGQRENIEVLTDNDSLFVWSGGLKKMVKILTSKLGFVKNTGDESIGGKKTFTGSFGTQSDMKVQVGNYTQETDGVNNAVNLKMTNTSVLGGIIKVKIASSYLNKSAYGCIEKVFNLYWDGSSANFYKSNSFVSMCGEKTAAEWFIGEPVKSENNELLIPIVNRSRKSNRVTVFVEFCNYLGFIRAEVSLSDPYNYTGDDMDNMKEFFYHPGDVARLKKDLVLDGFRVGQNKAIKIGRITPGVNSAFTLLLLHGSDYDYASTELIEYTPNTQVQGLVSTLLSPQTNVPNRQVKTAVIIGTDNNLYVVGHAHSTIATVKVLNHGTGVVIFDAAEEVDASKIEQKFTTKGSRYAVTTAKID